MAEESLVKSCSLDLNYDKLILVQVILSFFLYTPSPSTSTTTPPYTRSLHPHPSPPPTLPHPPHIHVDDICHESLQSNSGNICSKNYHNKGSPRVSHAYYDPKPSYLIFLSYLMTWYLRQQAITWANVDWSLLTYGTTRPQWVHFVILKRISRIDILSMCC